MSFHGGLIAAPRHGRCWRGGAAFRWASLADVACAGVCHRARARPIANFINANSGGRAATCRGRWCFQCRPAAAPSEPALRGALEGLVLFVLLYLAIRRGALARPWLVSGLFGIGYGLARIVVRVLPRAGSAARLPAGRGDDGNAAVVPLVGWGVLLVLRARTVGPTPQGAGDPRTDAGGDAARPRDRATSSRRRGRSPWPATWRCASGIPRTATT